jgi:pyruvate formate lyase activating enzyme
MESGLISHIQRYSLEDGPGIRTTVFLKGCPLSCRWCHNPENRLDRTEIMVLESRCIRCGCCSKACPDPDKDLSTNPWDGSADCSLCGACVEACPTGARQMIGRPMTVTELLSEVLPDVLFFDDSGGGVTFSGGEPLLQAEFLCAGLEACRLQGIHTSVDTCGYARPADLAAVAALTNLFLYDLKFMDNARHMEYTGVSNEAILKNLELLGQIHENVWVRVPVIPGVNDDEDQLEAMARFAASVPAVRQVNVLPYHRTGRLKFQRLKQAFPLAAVQPPSAAKMDLAISIFSAYGLHTKAGGS